MKLYYRQEQELEPEKAVKKLIKDALNMIHKCQKPDESLPEESHDINLREINKKAFKYIDAITQRFSNSRKAELTVREKQDLFMVYPLDFNLL